MVFGLSATSSLKEKLPQLVAMVTVHVRLESRWPRGLAREPSGLGLAAGTFWQPVSLAGGVAGAAAPVSVLFLLEPPQPAARASAATSTGSGRRRGMARKDNRRP